jgi:hypothetical protein
MTWRWWGRNPVSINPALEIEEKLIMAGKRKHIPPGIALAVLALTVALAGSALAEFSGSASLLPAGTELGEEAYDQPREMFRSESSGGHKS